MTDSEHMRQARDLLRGIEGKELTVDARRDRAIALAGLLLREADAIETRSERAIQVELGRMMGDRSGKVFTTCMTDQAFRTNDSGRVADQIRHLIDRYGVPKYLSWDKRAAMHAFRLVSRVAAPVLVPVMKSLLRKEMSRVILPGEEARLGRHMEKRRQQGVRVNLNHLGEAILGEEEALHRLQVYLDDLARPDVEYISVKISTICSQINFLAWEETLHILSERLRQLYRAAASQTFRRADGSEVPKFVNLDMEEYRDLHLTAALFERVLSEEEFFQHEAGIVLQAYVPDSYHLQEHLTAWAQKRVEAGGAPIKIRIVKGANLAMEQVESALHGWPQAPYPKKLYVDANYKRMVEFGTRPEHARAVRLGIASHNLFDVSLALILCTERQVHAFVGFEMLEGMADHIRRAVQKVAGEMLLYCPAAKKEEFQNAVAYLIRRLDENTAEENFLRHSFELKEGSKEWKQQAEMFSQACALANSVSAEARRNQDRALEPDHLSVEAPFANEPDTDWALEANRHWVEGVLREALQGDWGQLPLVLNGEEVRSTHTAAGYDPSRPDVELYTYSLATPEQADQLVSSAKAAEESWAAVSVAERCLLLRTAAKKLRERRGLLMGAMVADGGKTVFEADPEIAEAIDFLEYYARSMEEHASLQGLSWHPKGTVLVTPPWNFPLAIPLGGVAAALVTGNCVIFKPAAETALVAWLAAQALWDAGVPKTALQFVTCEDDPVGTQLIRDPRINSVILTGATATARHFLNLRPDLDLHAETGGKNAIIITRMADRDLAVKDAVHSAFGHGGQKCSACSLLVCDAQVYDDPQFRRQLRDAAASLKVGSAWDLATRINPLIHPPQGALERGLTTLDQGEEWLLEPKMDPKNPRLWSPGIKLGVRPGSFTAQTELFGPVLGVVRVESLDEALQVVNASDYGLTSGIHSLDEREIEQWVQQIQVGNKYVNRGITGAVVRRQPFGGCKQSSFGRGSKAGGPNYLSQLMHVEETELPDDLGALPEPVKPLDMFVRELGLEADQSQLWSASISSYAYWMEQEFGRAHDPSLIQGEDNLFSYVPHRNVVLRVQEGDALLDIYRVMAAALTAGTWLEVSYADEQLMDFIHHANWTELPNLQLIMEEESALCTRIQSGGVDRVRCLSEPSEALRHALIESKARLLVAPVLANGRLELLQYLREVSLSYDYHRYGNLGDREEEARTPLIEARVLVTKE